MKESKLSYRIDPIREMIFQFDTFIRGYRERTGNRVAAMTCDMLPVEVAASLGLVPVRLAPFSGGHCTCEGISDITFPCDTYDCLVVPETCAGRKFIKDMPLPVHCFNVPSGYGEEPCLSMAASLDALARAEGLPGLGSLDAAHLKFVTGEYNALRRLVRGISAARKDKPDMLSCRDMAVIFEAAVIFPPAVVAELLAAILKDLNGAESAASQGRIPVLAYSSFTGDSDLLDEIEEAGCLVLEDDACGGRRQFDMSYNVESDHLLAEILDAFSYRPLCPSTRPLEERVELFYSQLKRYGIDMVVVIDDCCCASRKRDIDALRIRLMRLGIDPLVVDSNGAVEKVRDYILRC